MKRNNDRNENTIATIGNVKVQESYRDPGLSSDKGIGNRGRLFKSAGKRAAICVMTGILALNQLLYAAAEEETDTIVSVEMQSEESDAAETLQQEAETAAESEAEITAAAEDAEAEQEAETAAESEAGITAAEVAETEQEAEPSMESESGITAAAVDAEAETISEEAEITAGTGMTRQETEPDEVIEETEDAVVSAEAEKQIAKECFNEVMGCLQQIYEDAETEGGPVSEVLDTLILQYFPECEENGPAAESNTAFADAFLEFVLELNSMFPENVTEERTEQICLDADAVSGEVLEQMKDEWITAVKDFADEREIFSHSVEKESAGEEAEKGLSEEMGDGFDDPEDSAEGEEVSTEEPENVTGNVDRIIEETESDSEEAEGAAEETEADTAGGEESLEGSDSEEAEKILGEGVTTPEGSEKDSEETEEDTEESAEEAGESEEDIEEKSEETEDTEESEEATEETEDTEESEEATEETEEDPEGSEESAVDPEESEENAEEVGETESSQSSDSGKKSTSASSGGSSSGKSSKKSSQGSGSKKSGKTSGDGSGSSSGHSSKKSSSSESTGGDSGSGSSKKSSHSNTVETTASGAEDAVSAGGYTQEQLTLFRNFVETIRQSWKEALNRVAGQDGFPAFGMIRKILNFVQNIYNPG